MIVLAEDDGLGDVPPFSSSVNWIGCGECDVSFPCNNGQAKCIRLSEPTPILFALTFEEELRQIINKHSIENGSNTPDFILAEYLISCLTSFDKARNASKIWKQVKGFPPGATNVTSNEGGGLTQCDMHDDESN